MTCPESYPRLKSEFLPLVEKENNLIYLHSQPRIISFKFSTYERVQLTKQFSIVIFPAGELILTAHHKNEWQQNRSTSFHITSVDSISAGKKKKNGRHFKCTNDVVLICKVLTYQPQSSQKGLWPIVSLKYLIKRTYQRFPQKKTPMQLLTVRIPANMN